MKKVSFSLFLLMIVMETWAQNPKIDSLKKELGSSSRQQSFPVLWELAFEYLDIRDSSKALNYAYEANEIGREIGDSLSIVKSGRFIGQIIKEQNSLDESIAVSVRVLAIARRNKFDKEIKHLLNSLAIVHSYKAEYDKALQYLFESLVIREKENDLEGISIIQNNIGYTYYDAGNPGFALDYYLKSRVSKIKAKSSYDLDRLYVNIAMCHLEMKKLEDAKKYLDSALTQCSPVCTDKIKMEIDLGIGIYFLLRNNYSDSKGYIKNALDIALQGDNVRFSLDAYKLLLEISMQTNQISEAKYYLKCAESLRYRDQFKSSLLELFADAADLFEIDRDFEKANTYRKKCSELRDGIFHQEVNRSVMRVQTLFAERENLAKIESQKEMIRLQADSLRQHRLLNGAIALVSILTLILAFLLYRNNKQKQKINDILDQKVRERTIELEKNRDELRQSHSEQSVMLKKVSSDLKSSMATIKGLANVASRDLSSDKSIYFKEMKETTEKVINYLRRYSE